MSIPPFLASLAQTTQQAVSGAAATTQQSAPQPEVPAFARIIQQLGMLPIVAAVILLFWFSSRSKKKAEQQKLDQLNSMKRGVRVQTIGGILGSVVEVNPDWVLVKVDESNNTKVKFARSAIHRVLGGEEAETK